MSVLRGLEILKLTSPSDTFLKQKRSTWGFSVSLSKRLLLILVKMIHLCLLLESSYSTGQRLMKSMRSLFENVVVEPCLLHGDLWSGNVSSDKNGDPVILDPACYCKSIYFPNWLYQQKCKSLLWYTFIYLSNSSFHAIRLNDSEFATHCFPFLFFFYAFHRWTQWGRIWNVMVCWIRRIILQFLLWGIPDFRSLETKWKKRRTGLDWWHGQCLHFMFRN